MKNVKSPGPPGTWTTAPLTQDEFLEHGVYLAATCYRLRCTRCGRSFVFVTRGDGVSVRKDFFLCPNGCPKVIEPLDPREEQRALWEGLADRLMGGDEEELDDFTDADTDYLDLPESLVFLLKETLEFEHALGTRLERDREDVGALEHALADGGDE